MTKIIDATVQQQTKRVVSRTPFSAPLSTVEIRDAVQISLRHVLTDSDLAVSREFYGTPGGKDVGLVNDGSIPWPDGLDLRANGYQLRFAGQRRANKNQESDRVLGIFLSGLDVRGPANGFLDGNITLFLSNVGGTRNGGVIGGCQVYYAVDRIDGVINTTYVWAFDP